MAYRNGTYVAFHANSTSDPTESDIRYFNLLKAWAENDKFEFDFVNSHDKASAVRDTSKRETLRASLMERLRNSKNMLLIIGKTTKTDTDWVPFEIQQAVDQYKLPVIAAYPDYNRILKPTDLFNLWPHELHIRMQKETAKVIHIPFSHKPVSCAINQFHISNLPSSAYSYYSEEAHRNWEL